MRFISKSSKDARDGAGQADPDADVGADAGARNGPLLVVLHSEEGVGCSGDGGSGGVRSSSDGPCHLRAVRVNTRASALVSEGWWIANVHPCTRMAALG